MTRSYKLLGSLEIEENGRLSPLMKSSRGCAIVAYLIVTGNAQPRAEIADLLWESTVKNSPRGNLRRLLRFIRSKVPELVATRHTLAFQPDPATQIDYQQLQAALDQAHSDKLNPARLQQLDHGLQQYRSELLSTFYVEAAPRFNEWLTVAREQLRREVWEAYERLCAAYFASEAWELGITAARRWVQLDELHEASQRWLIRFLLGNGQAEAARQQLETCRQRLWEELGAEPEAETEALAAQLAEAEVSTADLVIPDHLTWQPDPLPDPKMLAPLGDLPPHSLVPFQPNDDFTGREGDLVQLGELLLPREEEKKEIKEIGRLGDSGIQSPNLPISQYFDDAQHKPRSSAVAITGMGGMGKTQLAVEFAYRYGRFFAGGVYWLSFADAESVAEEVAAIGGERGMGLFKEADRITLTDQVGRVQQAWQEATPRLLIFDNCEEEALLQQWLPVSGGCRVLLTSRRSEWTRELGVLAHPLLTLTRAESIGLLQRLAPRLPATLEIDQIANQLGDLPLALHLAGSFLRRYQRITPAAYLQQLDKIGLLQHPSLQGRASTLSPTHHELSLARTFDINFEQLDPEDEVDAVAQKLLAHIACFAPGEPIPQQLLLDTLGQGEDVLLAELLAEDSLFRLQELGFIETKGQDVVVMHRLIVAFVEDVFAQKEQAVQDGLLAVGKQAIQQVEAYFQRNAYTSQLPFTATHVRHLVGKLLPLKNEQAAYLAALWSNYLLENADYKTAVLTLNATRSINLGEYHPVMGLVENTWGMLHWRMGAYALAQTAYDRAVTNYEQTVGKTTLKTAGALIRRGFLALTVRAFDKAEADYQRAHDILAALLPPKHPFFAMVYSGIGALHNLQGRYAMALSQYELALSIQKQTVGPNHSTTLSILNYLGETHWRRGDYAAADSYFAQTLAARKQILGLNHLLTALSFDNMGLLKARLGAFAEAQGYHEQALAVCQKVLGDEHPKTARSLSNLGAVLAQLGQTDKARQLLAQALAVQRKAHPIHDQTADSLDQLGNLLLNQGNLKEAHPHLAEALAARQQLFAPNHIDVGRSLLSLGKLAEAEGEQAEAKKLYEQALAILEETAVSTHPDLAWLRQRLASFTVTQP